MLNFRISGCKKRYIFKLKMVEIRPNRSFTGYKPIKHKESLKSINYLGMSFIYIFLKNKKPIYVGQTRQLAQRMSGHSLIKRMGKPDELVVFPIDSFNIDYIESFLIDKLNPRFNIKR